MELTLNSARSLRHCPGEIQRKSLIIMRSLTIMPYVRTPGFSPFEERTLPKRISFDGG